MFVVLLPLWKPHWDSERIFSAIESTSLFKRILDKALPAVDNNEIPRQFSQSLLSPFHM